MLFPNKKTTKNVRPTNFVAFTTTKKKAKTFNEIKNLFETKKTAFCKTNRKQILELKKPFFLFRLKQWTIFTQHVLKNSKQKTMLIYAEKLKNTNLIKEIKNNNFLDQPQMLKPGILTNFNIQKKQQIRFQKKKQTNIDPTAISMEQLKKDKPQQFFFIHPEAANPLIKETKYKQFPVVSTENLSEAPTGTFALFLNIFKEYSFVLNFIKKINTTKTKKRIFSLRKNFLQQQRNITKQLIIRKWTTKPERTTLNATKEITKLLNKNLNKLWYNYNLSQWPTKTKKRWYKFLNLSKIVKLKKNIKKIKNFDVIDNNFNTLLYVNGLLNITNKKNIYWNKESLKKVQKQFKAKNFFIKLNNLAYLKKALTENFIKTNKNFQFRSDQNINISWLIPSLTQTHFTTNLNGENFSLNNFKDLQKKNKNNFFQKYNKKRNRNTTIFYFMTCKQQMVKTKRKKHPNRGLSLWKIKWNISTLMSLSYSKLQTSLHKNDERVIVISVQSFRSFHFRLK